jgi:hypothetical protein
MCLHYLVNNPNKFCAVAFAIFAGSDFCCLKHITKGITFNPWVVTQQRQSSGSRRIFCCVLCLSILGRKHDFIPFCQEVIWVEAPVGTWLLVSLRGEIDSREYVSEGGPFVDCGFVHVILVVDRHSSDPWR